MGKIFEAWDNLKFHIQQQTDINVDEFEQILTAYEGEDEELKEWQVLAGKFASMANCLANILISGKITSNDIDLANEVLDEVIPYLVFEEGEW